MGMEDHPVVSSDDWRAARVELLHKEKEFTKLREEMTQLRQDLPWERVEKDYIFTGPDGPVTLAELFGDCSQLLVYHFMFGADWDTGCKICTMCADHYDPQIVHLKARDVSMVTISLAPIEKLEAYRKRMNWGFTWVSAHDSDFNQDFHVSYSPEEVAAGTGDHNYNPNANIVMDEYPGISAFFRNDAGEIFHTYSSYARGLENILGIYNLLDMVAKGRDEEGLPFPMAWVNTKDNYA